VRAVLLGQEQDAGDDGSDDVADGLNPPDHPETAPTQPIRKRPCHERRFRGVRESDPGGGEHDPDQQEGRRRQVEPEEGIGEHVHAGADREDRLGPDYSDCFLRAERERTFRLVEGEPLPTSFGGDLYREIFQDDPAAPAQPSREQSAASGVPFNESSSPAR
jgi:hypothetical protein